MYLRKQSLKRAAFNSQGEDEMQKKGHQKNRMDKDQEGPEDKANKNFKEKIV